MQSGLKQTNSWSPSSIGQVQNIHGRGSQGANDLAYRTYVAEAIEQGHKPLNYSDWIAIQ